MRPIPGVSATLVLGMLTLSAIPSSSSAQQQETPSLPTSGERAAAATLTGTLVGRDDGQAVQYGVVSLGEKRAARFTDGDGHFRITPLLPGQYLIRARQVGYAALDTAVQVNAAPAVTTVTLRMVRLPPLTLPVRVEARGSKDCVSTGAPDSMANPSLAAIFAQLRENSDRSALLLDQYPFRYTRETRIVRHLEASNDLLDRSNYQT